MPGYWNDDQGGGQAPPSYPVNQPSGGHPGGWVSEPSDTFSTPPRPDPVVDGRSAALLSSSLASAAEDPYDVLEAFTDLSKTHGQTGLIGAAGQHDLTKYGKSWDFNPDNPDNLIGMDTHTLGSFIAVDSSGNPILDSNGNPVFTSFGKALHDDMQDQGIIGSNQEVLNEDALQDYIDTFSFDEIHDIEKDFWRDSFDQSWYGMDDFDYGFYGGGPRTDTAMQDLGVWGATPLSEIESVGFDQFVPQYEKEFTEERIASPLHVKGMTPAGFEYLGSPEFGTRFYEV